MQIESTEEMPLRASDDVVRVRQAVRARAVAAGFSLVDQTKIVTAASEIGRNTVDYGGGGTLRLETLRDGQRRGVRLTFVDQGPGIADLSMALKDGYSTGTGLGLGLSGGRWRLLLLVWRRRRGRRCRARRRDLLRRRRREHQRHGAFRWWWRHRDALEQVDQRKQRQAMPQQRYRERVAALPDQTIRRGPGRAFEG